MKKAAPEALTDVRLVDMSSRRARRFGRLFRTDIVRSLSSRKSGPFRQEINTPREVGDAMHPCQAQVVWNCRKSGQIARDFLVTIEVL